MRDILEQVSHETGYPVSQLLGPGRQGDLFRARATAYLRAYEDGYTMEGIGFTFGRHHTTIMSGIQRAREGFPKKPYTRRKSSD